MQLNTLAKIDASYFDGSIWQTFCDPNPSFTKSHSDQLTAL